MIASIGSEVTSTSTRPHTDAAPAAVTPVPEVIPPPAPTSGTWRFDPARPAPDPHNAGITPGYRHLARSEEFVTRGQLRLAFRRRDRDAARAVATLRRELDAMQRRAARR